MQQRNDICNAQKLKVTNVCQGSSKANPKWPIFYITYEEIISHVIYFLYPATDMIKTWQMAAHLMMWALKIFLFLNVHLKVFGISKFKLGYVQAQSPVLLYPSLYQCQCKVKTDIGIQLLVYIPTRGKHMMSFLHFTYTFSQDFTRISYDYKRFFSASQISLIIMY